MTAKVNIMFFMVLLFDWLKSLLIEMVRLARENIVVAFFFIIPVSFFPLWSGYEGRADGGSRQGVGSSALLPGPQVRTEPSASLAGCWIRTSCSPGARAAIGSMRTTTTTSAMPKAPGERRSLESASVLRSPFPVLAVAGMASSLSANTPCPRPRPPNVARPVPAGRERSDGHGRAIRPSSGVVRSVRTVASRRRTQQAGLDRTRDCS